MQGGMSMPLHRWYQHLHGLVLKELHIASTAFKGLWQFCAHWQLTMSVKCVRLHSGHAALPEWSPGGRRASGSLRSRRRIKERKRVLSLIVMQMDTVLCVNNALICPLWADNITRSAITKWCPPRLFKAIRHQILTLQEELPAHPAASASSFDKRRWRIEGCFWVHLHNTMYIIFCTILMSGCMHLSPGHTYKHKRKCCSLNARHAVRRAITLSSTCNQILRREGASASLPRSDLWLRTR